MYSGSSLLIHKDDFAGFCQQIFKKKFQKAFEGKLTKKFCHA